MKKKMLKVSTSLALVFSLTLSNVVANYADTTKFLDTRSKNTTHFLDDDHVVRVIVQTKNNSKIEGGASDYSHLIKKIHQITGEITIKQSFDYLVSGFSFDVKRKYIPQIVQLDEVKSIKEARAFYPTMVDAVTMTEVQKVWTNKQYKGEGMVVSVIDTGIDVEHKDMRLDNPDSVKIKEIKQSDETNFSLKVPYGYNYADGNDIVKDSDLNSKSMHGMHVAGIVGANATDEEVDKNLGIDGVAPEAQLLAMKVFSNSENVGTAYEDSIVKAIEDSVKYGADVINMSLGTDNGFHDDTTPEAIAIAKAREAGVVVVVSAGNAGLSTTSDEFQRIPTNDLMLKDTATVGEPSTASSAISVASANNTTETGYFGKLDGNSFLFKVATHRELWDTTLEYPIVDVGFGESDDYLSNGNPIDLTGKIAFITRGNIQFSEKYERAIQHHAAGIIVANDVEGEFGMAGVGSFNMPGITVDKATGETLKNLITENSKVMIQFDQKSYIGSSEVSSFTAWGPAHDLTFKPEIMAPGGNIYSTINNDGYEYNSGTSMAAPHISGAIALMKGALKDSGLNFDYFVKKSLMNTAKPLLDVAQNTGLEVSPRRQGAGLAQVDNAIVNRVLITDENGESAKALKEVENKTTFTLTLENLGNKVEKYTLRFGKVLTEHVDENTKKIKDIEMENAVISADKSVIEVASNHKEVVTITLDTTNAPLQQFVEGYIYFDSDDSPSLVYPYLGFNGDWGKEAVFDERKDENGVYNTLGLVNGSSYLGSSFNPMTFSESVDQEKVAFSPNGDENFDDFTTVLGLLRNVEKLQVDIVESESDSAEPFVTLTNKKNVRKPLYKTKDMVSFYTGNWDGKIFNQKTGQYEVAKDGQYYVRLKATLPSKKTTYQYKYLPIKLDTTKPTLTIVSQHVEGNEYVIQFKTSDSGVGIDEEGVGVIVDDGEKETLYPDGNDVYEYRLAKADIDSGNVKSITLGALDLVYNVRTETIVFNDSSVLFHNANALVGSKSRYLENDQYQLLGRVGKNVLKLWINNTPVVLDGHDFEVSLKLQEGLNEVHFVAKNSNDEIINEGRITMQKDTIAPKVSITNLDVNQFQKLEKNKINIEGIVVDENNTPVTLRLGHKSVTVNNGVFSGETTIDWTRVVNVRATDEAGNETVIPIRTVYDEAGAFKIYYSASLGAINFYNATTPYIVDGKLKVSGHLNQKVKALYIGNQEVPIDEAYRFTVDIPVKEVDNHISIKVIGLDGSVIHEDGRAVYYDKTLPNLQVHAGATIKDNTIYTNNEKLLVTGEVSDNGQGYRMYLNGNEVALYEESVSMGNEVTKQNFEKAFMIENEDTILFEVEDSFGNNFERRYKVVLDKIAPSIHVEDKVLYEYDTLAVDTEENSDIKVSLDGEAFTGDTPLSKGNHTLIAEAKDLAGNTTRFEKEITVLERFILKHNVLTTKVGEEVDLGKVILFDQKENKEVKIQSIRFIGDVPKTAGKYQVNVEVILPTNHKVSYPITLHVRPIVTTFKNQDVKVENVVLNQELSMKMDKVDIARFEALKDKTVSVYDIYFVDESGKRVSIPRGNYVVTIKKEHDLPIKGVYYIDESGNLESHAFIDKGNEVMFNTTHFSIYAVEYQKDSINKVESKDEINTNVQENVQTSDEIEMLKWAFMLSLAGFILLRKHRKNKVE